MALGTYTDDGIAIVRAVPDGAHAPRDASHPGPGLEEQLHVTSHPSAR